MVVSCEEVWREISNYLDGELDPGLRAAMEEHFRGCKHCTAVLDGTRNVVSLYGDERMFVLPAGFSQRLHRRLEGSMPGARGTAFGWLVAVAAAALVIGSFEVGNSSVSRRPELRSEHAQPPAVAIPPDMTVVISEDGKTFHVPGCRFVHDRARVRATTAGEAIREGHTPCVRCLRKYLHVMAATPEREISRRKSG
jgi:Putative zinc-finger